MENKYLPSQLKNIVMEYKYGKKDSCELITGQGKRCKNATKYRFGDEVKDCGSYCAKHCKIWIKDLINSLYNGDIIIDGKKVNTPSFELKDTKIYETNPPGSRRDLIIYPKSKNVEYSYYDNRWIHIKDYRNNTNHQYMDTKDLLDYAAKEMCLWEGIRIRFIVDGKFRKISSINVGGVRGWKIFHRDTYISVEKEFIMGK